MPSSPDVVAHPTVRIATALPSVLASERRVLEEVLHQPERVVESTAQEVADRVGVGRSTVVRACQAIGYKGYPQLRVALAAELAHRDEEVDYGSSALGRLRADIAALAAALPQVTAVLDEDTVERAVGVLTGSRRLLVLANGLSAPLATDMAMRLTAVGRPADFVADSIGQQIAARGLAPGDGCVVLSGSGASEATLKVARAARQGGAAVVAVTSFRGSPLGELADVELVVAPAATTFQHELERTSRIALAVLVESLVGVVAARSGAVAQATHDRVLDILSDNLAD
ncbi:MurR/RpiR family transcriptional regulator [Cellulomonas sp. PS-H5]|uniref:MurR/RpiR family transcriptional regulator n=1 Tax=Cellulomonas sp. PS-H5 TaxID=2820400 RepID=UPI001C4FEEFF|nr:MurR/RpiR family transcriptional regulator [Cellulomonas sp. PS-H5]MBW0254398.1 MurR/RpiR family transcriptional regulator [Cellulomonas sp. PS-H5]